MLDRRRKRANPSRMSKTDRDLDGGRLGGKIARYGKVSTTMAGLAARLAGERFLGIASAAAGIAKILFFVFLALFIVSLLMGVAGRRRLP